MFTAYLIVTIATIAINVWIAVADLTRSPVVLKNSAAVNVPESWIPMLGSLKAAGAAGLLLGLFGVPFLGTAAAIGLVLFYFGAVLTHVRARVFRTIALPGILLALAAAALVVDLAQIR
ncbi:DoxX family protein [Amycolatopsis sp. NPDC049868]|uniref:DoxX family protein n=1 Tax=Amycolatopsis sp. NPDC049868 TaxID=3363934 RepID=UPI0037BDE1EE